MWWISLVAAVARVQYVQGAMTNESIAQAPWFQICGGAQMAHFGQLFTNASAWPFLRERTDSIKFFIGNIESLPQVVSGGYQAVAGMLEETGIVLDVEGGGLRGFNCDGASYALQTLQKIEPLLAAGIGSTASMMQITFDGPFAHSLHQDAKLCPLTPAQVAGELFKNINTTRSLIASRYPHLSVRFAWNEPVPWYHVGSEYPPFHNGTTNDFGDLLELLELVTRAGVDFDAFHADSPYMYNQEEGGGYPKLGKLMEAVRAKGLQFGHYFNNEPKQEGDFERGTLADSRAFVAALGKPDHAIVESWYPYPRSALPEAEANTLAHTALAAWEIFAT